MEDLLKEISNHLEAKNFTSSKGQIHSDVSSKESGTIWRHKTNNGYVDILLKLAPNKIDVTAIANYWGGLSKPHIYDHHIFYWDYKSKLVSSLSDYLESLAEPAGDFID